MGNPLDPARWRRIREVLDEILAAPEADREALLRERCGDDADLAVEVRSFVRAHDEAGSFIEGPAGAPSDVISAPEIDRYRIIGELDRGGMGVVYLAVRDDGAYRQTVAVKVLRHGLGSAALVARFRAERQILARLDHPNIARLLDGGTTRDGRPFLVMEHVVGLSIDVFCERQGVDTDARIRLFQKVCAAVQFAHRHLVVHRDLKPENILVTPDGEPKLLDFGIAKLLDPHSLDHTVAYTRTGAFGPMTPAYASPEQARGQEVTTSSDVYSLGVVLYELLTGHRPYDTDAEEPLEALEKIARAEPERPSRRVSRGAGQAGGRVGGRTGGGRAGRSVGQAGGQAGGRTGGQSRGQTGARGGPGGRGTAAALRRRLRGDLDTILLKALRKEPERRYASAQALSDDLDRHLRGLPVEARPDTFRYRAAKFTRRHAVAVAASVALLAVLVTSLLVLLVQRRTILAERDEARRVSSFLTELFAVPDPTRSRGETVTAREILDRGARSIAEGLDRSPATQGALMLTMGRSYKNLGLLREADDLLSRAEGRLEDAHGHRGTDVASALHEQGDVALALGRYPEAVARFEEALALRREALGEDDPAVAETRFRLGRALTESGDWDRAETELAAALRIARDTGAEALSAEILQRWASVAAERGRLDEAERRYRLALETLQRIHGERHPSVVLALNDLADLERRREHWSEARAHLEEARTLAHALFEGDHPYLAITVGNLGLVQLESGDLPGAAETFAEALRLHRAVFPPDHPRLAILLNNLALLRRAQGDIEGAAGVLRESLQILEAGLGPDHPETANAANNLAELYLGMGRLDDAEPLLSHAVEVLERTHPHGHPRLAIALANRADLLQQRGDLEQAAAVYARAIEMIRSGPDPESARLAHLLSNSGTVLQALGDADGAVARYEEALALARRGDGTDDGPDDVVAGTATRLALLELEREHWARTVELAGFALEHFPDEMPWRLQWVASATNALAKAHLALGEADAAAAALGPVLDEARASLGDDDETTRALAATLDRLDRLGRADQAGRAGASPPPP